MGKKPILKSKSIFFVDPAKMIQLQHGCPLLAGNYRYFCGESASLKYLSTL
jgi:hypothetical protein